MDFPYIGLSFTLSGHCKTAWNLTTSLISWNHNERLAMPCRDTQIICRAKYNLYHFIHRMMANWNLTHIAFHATHRKGRRTIILTPARQLRSYDETNASISLEKRWIGTTNAIAVHRTFRRMQLWSKCVDGAGGMESPLKNSRNKSGYAHTYSHNTITRQSWLKTSASSIYLTHLGLHTSYSSK